MTLSLDFCKCVIIPQHLISIYVKQKYGIYEESANFFCEWPEVSILEFMGLSQLLSAAAGAGKLHRQYVMKECGCVSIKVYFQIQVVGWI